MLRASDLLVIALVTVGGSWKSRAGRDSIWGRGKDELEVAEEVVEQVRGDIVGLVSGGDVSFTLLATDSAGTSAASSLSPTTSRLISPSASSESEISLYFMRPPFWVCLLLLLGCAPVFWVKSVKEHR